MIRLHQFVAAATLTLLVGTPSAFAQHRGGGGGGRSAGHPSAPAGRATARPGGPMRSAGPSVYRGSRGPIGPRTYGGVRGYGVGQRGGVYMGRVAPRGGVYGGGFGHGYAYGYRAPIRFYRPYYTFHPRFSLGFGLWVGFPIGYYGSFGYYDPFYAYGYPYPYPYSYPYPYPYPAYGYPSYGYPSYGYPSYPATAAPSYPAYPQSGTVGVQPGQANTDTGGVSFEISPANAQVFVDGAYVGTAGMFTPTSQPLGLAPGRHHIEIRAQGYHTMSFDADIVAGQVIPYQGTMER